MTLSSKIVLINSKNEILFYLRDNKPSIDFPGYWDLIGGGLEDREDAEKGLEREIREEIGIDIEEIKKVKFIQIINCEEYDLKVKCPINFVFRGYINLCLKKIDLTEGQKLRYFKIQELDNPKVPRHWREFILEHKELIFN